MIIWSATLTISRYKRVYIPLIRIWPTCSWWLASLIMRVPSLVLSGSHCYWSIISSLTRCLPRIIIWIISASYMCSSRWSSVRWIGCLFRSLKTPLSGFNCINIGATTSAWAWPRTSTTTFWATPPLPLTIFF